MLVFLALKATVLGAIACIGLVSLYTSSNNLQAWRERLLQPAPLQAPVLPPVYKDEWVKKEQETLAHPPVMRQHVYEEGEDDENYDYHGLETNLQPLFLITAILLSILLIRSQKTDKVTVRHQTDEEEEEVEHISEINKDVDMELTSLVFHSVTDHNTLHQNECDYHHSHCNEPNWSCTTCFDQEQARLDLESELLESRSYLKVMEADNRRFQHVLDVFQKDFLAAIAENEKLNVSTAELKSENYRLKKRLDEAVKIGNENQERYLEVENKNAILQDEYVRVLDTNRHYQISNEEKEMAIGQFRLDLNATNQRHAQMKKRCLHLQASLETELIAKKNQLDWQLSDFEHEHEKRRHQQNYY